MDATERNYADSVTHCKAQGMTIASIHSLAENDAVKKLLRRTSYLGATETTTNGEWTWADGSPWDFTNPSNDGLKSSGETRIAFTTGRPQWQDWGRGNAKLGVVCRKPCGGSPALALSRRTAIDAQAGLL